MPFGKIPNFFKSSSAHSSSQGGASASSTKASNVAAGKIVSVNDKKTGLSATHLLGNSCLCLLGGKDDKGIFRERTMATLFSGDLMSEVGSTKDDRLELCEKIRNGDFKEIFFVNGSDAKSNTALKAVLGQEINGIPILKRLLTRADVKLTMLVSDSITISPKGEWNTHGGLIRNLDFLEIRGILDDI